MEHFRKIWDDEKCRWLVSHKDVDRRTAYKMFLENFPDAADVSFIAFCNQRSRLGACPRSNGWKGSRKPRPLYSEQIKKGYVRIKIAQPNVWVSKAKWVYMETHPWEDFTERSNYIFLDGDNRNFDPANIERVPLSLMGIFNGLGGCVPGDPDATRLRLAVAKVKVASLDAGEKMGLVGCYTHKGGHFRRFRADSARRMRELNSTPERKAECARRQREYRARLKVERPDEFAARAERRKAYLKEYMKRRRGK